MQQIRCRDRSGTWPLRSRFELHVALLERESKALARVLYGANCVLAQRCRAADTRPSPSWHNGQNRADMRRAVLEAAFGDEVAEARERRMRG